MSHSHAARWRKRLREVSENSSAGDLRNGIDSPKPIPIALSKKRSRKFNRKGFHPMMLYIMRHGLAEEPTPKGDDAARKLTPKGADKIRKAAAGMRATGLAFNLILTSPAARAA